MFKVFIAIFLLIPCATCALAQSSNLTISKEEQQARDRERHLILRTELTAEHQAYLKAQLALSTAATPEHKADLHRHTENIKALQRELAAINTQQDLHETSQLVPKGARPVVRARIPSTSGAATFWNPYNRASDPQTSTKFPTTP
jgi:hypothetical protein